MNYCTCTHLLHYHTEMHGCLKCDCQAFELAVHLPLAGFESINRARNVDPETSHIAAEGVSRSETNKAQCRALLAAHQRHPNGLTDEEAAVDAGIDVFSGTCYWHRASDLRKMGYIEWLYDDNEKLVKRTGSLGRPRGVSVLTEAGKNSNGNLDYTKIPKR